MLTTFLQRFVNLSYAALRVSSGIMFAVHGAQKVFGVLTDKPMPFDPLTQRGIGGVIELVCGALIALGLGTVPAAFLASGTMAVAYVQFHWKFQMGSQIWPPVNKGELALVYAFLFLYIACRGAGPFSLDKFFKRSGA